MSTFRFTSEPDVDLEETDSVALISGEHSVAFDCVAYLIESADGDKHRAYQIRYSHHYGPFSEAVRIGDLLAVGFGAHFYLFDTLNNKSLLAFSLEQSAETCLRDRDCRSVSVTICCANTCLANSQTLTHAGSAS